MKSPIISIVYTVVGVVVASNYGYLNDFSALHNIVSAILAVVLWPLILIGVNLNVTF